MIRGFTKAANISVDNPVCNPVNIPAVISTQTQTFPQSVIIPVNNENGGTYDKAYNCR